MNITIIDRLDYLLTYVKTRWDGAIWQKETIRDFENHLSKVIDELNDSSPCVIKGRQKAFENLAKEIVEKHYGRFFRDIDISRGDKVAILHYFGYSAEDVPR